MIKRAKVATNVASELKGAEEPSNATKTEHGRAWPSKAKQGQANHARQASKANRSKQGQAKLYTIYYTCHPFPVDDRRLMTDG